MTQTGAAPYLDRLPRQVRLIETGKTGLWSLQPFLRRYLSEHAPDFVPCGKDRAGRTAVLARRLWHAGFDLVMRPGSTVSERLAKRSAFKRWRAYRLIRNTYRPAAAVVGNSEGVVRDIAMITGVPDERMHLIRKPVITSDLFDRAARAPRQPCFFRRCLAGDSRAGRPAATKGVRYPDQGLRTGARQAALRLLILGEVHLRDSLSALAEQLGMSDDVWGPRWVPVPERYPAS